MINRFKMDNSKEEKLDRATSLKDQVSRIYMNTIAANEREDRLLNKKLDAIDMEHRAQFLRMKKVINDARSFSYRRFQCLSSDRRRFYEEKKCNTAPAGTKRSSLKGYDEKGDDVFAEDDVVEVQGNNQLVVNSQQLSNLQGGRIFKEQSLSARLEQTEAEHDKELVGRLQYTEKEVVRMRKSWVGKDNPQQARKRTFLPHLEKQPEIKATPANNGERSKSMRKAVQKIAYQSKFINGTAKKDVLPEIGARSLPKNIEGKTSLTGNNATMLRTLKRESAALSRSLPSSYS